RNITETYDNAEWYLDAGATNEQLIFEYDSTSTWTNAVNTLAIMVEKGYDSALIVTTDYHIRRSKLSFERVNKQENYQLDLTYVASTIKSDSEIKIDQSLMEKTRNSLNETIKYFGYLLKLYHCIDI